MESWSIQKAERVALELFKVKGEASRLPGYEDANYLLDTKREDRRYFVLKVVAKSTPIQNIECQHLALQHLLKGINGFSGPLPLLSANRKTIELVDGEQVRVLTYAPGSILADVKSPSLDLYRSLGQELGKIDSCLATFSHPNLDRDIEWDLAKLPGKVQNLRMISDLEVRSDVSHFLEKFNTFVEPILPSLRKSAIHNDANDHNVVVEGSAFFPKGIKAIIDYGDLINQALVFDPAIALAYAIMDSREPLKLAQAFIEGFVSNCPLTEEEVDVLYYLVGARLAHSLLMSAEKRLEAPDDSYLQISDKPARAAIKKWRSLSPHLTAQVLRKAAGLPFLTNSEPVLEWIRHNKSSFHPVILDTNTLQSLPVLDLSVGSPLFDDPKVVLKLDILRYSLGRYLEPRLVYQGDNYLEDGGRRTVHLGIDVFAPPQTIVSAPLRGMVYSVQDNHAEYDFGPTVILEHEVGDDLKFWTLYGHLSRDSTVRLREGQIVEAGSTVGRLGAKFENGGWSPHLHFQILTDTLGERGNFTGVANVDFIELWKRICPDPSGLLGLDSAKTTFNGANEGKLMEDRKKSLSPSLSTSYSDPIKMVRGHGTYLYSESGRKYLDCVNNVSHVGHSNPRVVEAIRSQAGILNTNTRYLHDNIVQLSKRIGEKLPGGLEVCFFVNSGSEANDLALRLAKAATGRQNFMVMESGYHGHTDSLIQVSHYKFQGKGGHGKASHVEVLPMPDTYRGLYRNENQQSADLYAKHADTSISVLENKGGVAAFIGETILSCGGQIEPPAGYLKSVYAKVRAAGGLCIADEVQTGFGRMGSHFWAFETQGVTPDIVTMGKPMGNGHPLAAVVTTRKIADAFANGMEYFNTFGGNPVSCAVGLSVLDELEAQDLQENARVVGRYFMSELLLMQREVEFMGDVRGRGLFLGIEIVKSKVSREPFPSLAKDIVERMKKRGVLLSTDGPQHNVLKIKPPIVFSEDNVDQVISELRLLFNLKPTETRQNKSPEKTELDPVLIGDSREGLDEESNGASEPSEEAIVNSTKKTFGEIRQEGFKDRYGKLNANVIEVDQRRKYSQGSRKRRKKLGKLVRSIWRRN